MIQHLIKAPMAEETQRKKLMLSIQYQKVSLYYNYNIVISYIPFISELFPDKELRKEIGPFICKIYPLNFIYQLCQHCFSILHNNELGGGGLYKERACLRHLMLTECPVEYSLPFPTLSQLGRIKKLVLGQKVRASEMSLPD